MAHPRSAPANPQVPVLVVIPEPEAKVRVTPP